jgi:hypothetical protein
VEIINTDRDNENLVIPFKRALWRHGDLNRLWIAKWPTSHVHSSSSSSSLR